MSGTTTNLIARKKSADGRALRASSSATSKVLARRRSVACLAEAQARVSRRRSFVSRQTGGRDADSCSASNALETAIRSLDDLRVRHGGTSLEHPSPPSLPVINVGDSIVCLSRDERLIGETRRQKARERIRQAETYSRDHYKYSLFAGGDPSDVAETEPHRELTPFEHVRIARASARLGWLGIEAGVAGDALSPRLEPTARARQEQLKSRRYDSEGGTILVYGDRTPIFVPKLDFSVLPNFRKPRLYNKQVAAKGKLAKYDKGQGKAKGKGKGKGIVGLLSLKFWN